MSVFFNKDTRSRKAKDISLHEQNLVEQKFVNERLQDKDFAISEEVAENLGLAAFAKIIDGMILSHVESRIEQGDKEATEMKENIERKMSALGISPVEISLDILKEATNTKLEKSLESIKELCTCLFDEVAPKKNFFDTVNDALFGSVAHDEIKNLVVSKLISPILYSFRPSEYPMLFKI